MNRLTTLGKALRKRPTDAEQLLWSRLRMKQISRVGFAHQSTEDEMRGVQIILASLLRVSLRRGRERGCTCRTQRHLERNIGKALCGNGREVFPLSAVLSNLFDFGIAVAVLIVILAIAGIGVSVYLLWLPALLILLIFLAVGLGMLLFCANLFFRDVKYIVEVILTFGIFFTPVFYEAERFGTWAPVLLFNPIGAGLESINAVVVLHQAP